MRKRPSQGRSRVTVTSILEAADRILRGDGYDAASTNRLARVAGFSVGSLYQYFRDKQGIVGALVDRELVAEAEALVPLFDRRVPSACAALADGIALMFARRASRAHVYRTLDQHAAELGAPVILEHLVAAQAPILSELLQRVGAQVLPRSSRSVDARLFTLARMASETSYAYAVDAPATLDGASVRAALVAAAERYLGEASASPEAVSLVTGWSKGLPGSGTRAELRARRRRESRAALLAAGMEPAALEPAAFVLGCLAEVSALTPHPPAGLTSDELLQETARFAEALRTA